MHHTPAINIIKLATMGFFTSIFESIFWFWISLGPGALGLLFSCWDMFRNDLGACRVTHHHRIHLDIHEIVQVCLITKILLLLLLKVIVRIK